eukprot:CAMPEP_0172613990 /NCGR_PEP_ID=MMETSP1068-20121228/49121_1 /TAXON_ID=35684 /ORGANISM="Pseudopedinella elastica, Strain CCMP716" /LENGTH=36 /DNA_ID= /DNA_START= /DNA_END= /DNA_ORIENTATION=
MTNPFELSWRSDAGVRASALGTFSADGRPVDGAPVR